MRVTRAPKHEGYTGLGSITKPGEDYDLFVDGRQIAWTYWGDALPAGQKWVSWGVAGWSGNHRTRKAAEQAQVREYATNPDLYDRLADQHEAERKAAEEKQRAEDEAWWQAREAERTRRRLGTDQPGETVLTIPAYHVFYADEDEGNAVGDWLAGNGASGVSTVKEIRVEQRAERQVIVYERPLRPEVHGFETETHVVTMTVAPPVIGAPPRPDLHPVIELHWPTKFPLIDYGQQLACRHCTARTAPADVAPWPCPELTAAIAAVPVLAGTPA